ncbi:hypothetical protein FH972_021778 [Carpinus fangiana]|uniref:D-lactate dehydrogenase (cytochrome) n=1 Tax=Carpinus fangiana TaxID=176857 RepID=A0A5N6KQY7_9ROSI|nr:hypothetical protein FH972_021778 [Carpinus fangiana]
MPRSPLIRSSSVVRQARLSLSSTCTACLGMQQRRSYATEGKDETVKSYEPKQGPAKFPAFKDQLWQSTTERVQREREEQERYAQERSMGGGGGRSLGLAVAILGTAGAFYLLGTMVNPKPSTASTLSLDDSTPPQHDTSSGTLQAAWADLRAIVGEENISTSDADLDSHSGSEWSSYTTSKSDRPFAVVRPGSTEDTAAIMKICHARRIPVTGYSGGTSLEGHFAATRGGICIDFGRMDALLALHADDMDCVVQPAMGWQDLNEQLAEHGLFFPPDPGPGAMIGGMVGTGCSGTNAYRYGTMKDWVISLTVVMADGTVVKTKQRPRKSSAGYDLTRLFIGSEGTLGLVTEATLRLTSAPSNPRVAVAEFRSVKDAAECVSKVVRAGVPIAAVELLDDVQMRCINQAGSTTKKWAEQPTLFFKFSGTQSGVKESISLVQGMARAAGSRDFQFARNADEADELWSARKEALWSVMAQKKDPSDHVWTTDVAVPISRLPVIVDETKADIAQSGLLGSIVGHVGDGNFHAIILYNDAQKTAAEEVVHRMVKRAVELEGTVTGEHGIGLVKRDYLPHELSKDAVDAMRALKKAWDPLCLLNCDKIPHVTCYFCQASGTIKFEIWRSQLRSAATMFASGQQPAYDWSDKKDECYRLYVEDKKPLDEVMRHFAEKHNFTPSKRAFQTQIHRWGFPTKKNPAWKDDALVSRVRQLWEQSTPHKTMLATLQSEGHDIKDRELTRLRARYKWFLRGPSVAETCGLDDGGTLPGPTHGPLNDHRDDPNKEKSTGTKRKRNTPDTTGLDRGRILTFGDTAVDPTISGLEFVHSREEGSLEVDSSQTSTAKGRRQRSQNGPSPLEGLASPSRYPSETRIDQAKAYLHLDNALYHDLRIQLIAICEQAGIKKKSTAGPERWQAVKDRLVNGNAHLHNEFFTTLTDVTHAERALALDVLCHDVAKRLRTVEAHMTVAEAKIILELNPAQTKQVRASFEEILRADKFVSKLALGNTRWRELQQTWIARESCLQPLFYNQLDPNGQLMRSRSKALDSLSNDVMKRLRDEQGGADMYPSRLKQAYRGPGPGPLRPAKSSLGDSMIAIASPSPASPPAGEYQNLRALIQHLHSPVPKPVQLYRQSTLSTLSDASNHSRLDATSLRDRTRIDQPQRNGTKRAVQDEGQIDPFLLAVANSNEWTGGGSDKTSTAESDNALANAVKQRLQAYAASANTASGELPRHAEIDGAVANLDDQAATDIRVDLALVLQLLALPNILALTDGGLKLLEHLSVQRRSAGDTQLDLAARGAHQLLELLAHAGEHAEAVVVCERLQEVLDRRLLRARGLEQLRDHLALVFGCQRRRGEDLAEFGVALEGAVQRGEGFGDGVERRLFRGGGVLCGGSALARCAGEGGGNQGCVAAPIGCFDLLQGASGVARRFVGRYGTYQSAGVGAIKTEESDWGLGVGGGGGGVPTAGGHARSDDCSARGNPQAF